MAERTSDCLRPVPNDRLEIRNDPQKGRGVFASAPIAAGTVIEAAPVIIVPASQLKLLDQTILHDYYFAWDGDPEGEGSGAVALGLVALCNHSRRPRARVRRNLAQGTLDLVALLPIAAGDEVTIDYNCRISWVKEGHQPALGEVSREEAMSDNAVAGFADAEQAIHQTYTAYADAFARDPATAAFCGVPALIVFPLTRAPRILRAWPG